MRLLLGVCSVLAAGAICLSAAGELSGRRAPGFSLPDMGYQYHDLADYRGKVVLLDIMKPGCPTCDQLGRALEQILQRFPEQVVVLSVVNPPETPASVAAYVARTASKAQFLFDCGQMAGSYLMPNPARPTIHVPHLFLIDGEGMIRNDYDSVAAAELTAEQLATEIEEMLAPTDTAQVR